jgi:hypothetical protein
MLPDAKIKDEVNFFVRDARSRKVRNGIANAGIKHPCHRREREGRERDERVCKK